VRVHPELLERQKLPASLEGEDIWQQRFEDIRAFERHLARNGTLILKFFLHMSKEEQRKQFLERIEEPAKRWKFSMGDVAERVLWDKYMAAYEDMIRQTSQPEAPWFVIPADHKWFTRMVVAGVLVQELGALELEFPKVEGQALKDLQEAGKALKAEGRGG
jgi:polyphosphate kinase 2 (PPK2 family)